jgi:hypothetical protein
VGATGATGPTGAQGNQGNQGNQGFQGASIANTALFSFSHTSGTASTGALGFTPKVAFYTGVVNTGGSGGDAGTANGFAIGTLGNARSSGTVMVEGPGSPQLPGVSAGFANNAIFGVLTPVQNTAQQSTFSRLLQVTAFSAAGIDLTWNVAVNNHEGNLLVIG